MLIIGDSNEISECSHVNKAKVKEIRWDLMRQEIKKTLKPYEEYIKASYYSKEYLKERYPTENDYIDSFIKFNTYAVLKPDGTWYEPGKMGWWGITNATPEQEREFVEQYEEKFIKSVNPEWYLTIVDCHI